MNELQLNTLTVMISGEKSIKKIYYINLLIYIFLNVVSRYDFANLERKAKDLLAQNSADWLLSGRGRGNEVRGSYRDSVGQWIITLQKVFICRY